MKKRKTTSLLTILISVVLVVGTIFFLIKLTSKPVEAAWFDDTWGYRVRITVNNSGAAVANQKVKLDIATDALITAGKIQSDCGDSRFTDQGGKPLNYYLDSLGGACNTNSTDYYVLIPQINAGATIIYHYYGNPGAPNGTRSAQFAEATFSPQSTSSASEEKSGGPVAYWKFDEGTGTSVYNTANPTASVTASSSGPNSPGTLANDNAIGTKAWSNASNAASSNNQYATHTGEFESEYTTNYLKATNFGFAIPSTATITGITTEVEWKDGTDDTGTVIASLKAVKGGVISSTALTTTTIASSDTYATLGGSSNLWGETWTYTDINASTFGVALSYTGYNLNTMDVDHIRVTVHYSSAVSLNGTISGATWQSADQCISGQCLLFDGTNDYVGVGSPSSMDISGAISISAWVKVNTITGNDHEIISNYNSAGNVAQYDFGIDNQNLKFVIANTGYEIYETAAVVNANTWHHVAMTNDGSDNVVLYLDGKSIPYTKTGSVTTPTSSFGGTAIGRPGDYNGQYFPGFIDNLKIYNYVRTPIQVKADFSSRGKGSEGTGAAFGASVQNSNLSNGLVGYWQMDEASWNNNCSTDTVLDSSGNGNHGDSCPSSTGPTGGALGKFGKSGSFDGSNDTVSIPNATSWGSSASVTFSLWVKPTTVTGTIGIMGSRAGGGNSGFDLDVLNGVLRWSSRVSGGGSAAGGSITTGSWQHIVATSNSTTRELSVYVNGVLAVTSIASTMSSSANPLTFSGTTAGGIFTGNMDEIRVYNRTLTSQEVTQLYNFAPGPAAYWRLDEKAGSVTYDSSGNSNTSSTFSGNTAWDSGKFGNAVRFDGTDDAILIPETTSTDLGATTDSYTVMAWIKPISGNTFLAKRSGTAIPFRFTAASTTSFIIQDGGTSVTSTSTTNVVNDGKWHHVAGVRNVDTDTIYLYIDGVLEDSDNDTITGSTANNADITMGVIDSALNNDWAGSIDDVKIYRYARSQKQIVEDMNAGHGNVGSPVGSAIGYWKFDEGVDNTCSGGTNDACNSGSGGSTLDGAGSGFASPGTSTSGWTSSGKYNKALTFDGSNDYVDMGTSSTLAMSGPFTLSAWVYKPSSLPTEAAIISRRVNGSTPINYQLAWDNDAGGIGFYVSSSVVSYTGSVSTGWHHVVGVYDGTNALIFLDGRQVASGARSAPDTSGTQNFNIGRKSGYSSLVWNEKIDEVKVYNFALTADEVKLDFNRGSSIVLGAKDDGSKLADGTGTAPVAYWNFDEKSGTAARDTSGNAGNGTITVPIWQAGKFGNALGFGGSSSITVTGSAAPLNALNTLSIGLWIKTTNSTSTGLDYQQPGLIWKDTPGVGTNDWNLTLNGGNINWTNGNGAGSSQTLTSTTTVNDDKWHHVLVTRNSSTGAKQIYIDGRLNNSTTHGTNDISNTADIVIGATQGTLSAATLDDIKIYNYVRTQAQVAQDFNRGAPVGWWKFDECQGTTAYDFGPNGNEGYNGNNGTINFGDSSGDNDSAGSCSSGTTTEMWNDGTTGKRNASLGFDGTNDYVDMGEVLDFPSRDLTVSAWVKGPTQVGEWNTIVSKADTSCGWGYRIEVLNGSVRFGFAGDVFGTIPSDSNWHHIVGVVSGGGATGTVYTDGRVTGTGSTGGVQDTCANLKIGSGPYGDFQGQIDDVRIYNYALSATQVKEIYTNGTVFFGPTTGTP